MKKRMFKILTNNKRNMLLLFVVSFFCYSNISFANIITQKMHDKYLRWKLNVENHQMVVNKDKNLVFIKTLDVSLFSSLSNELKDSKTNKYIKKIDFIPPSKKNNYSTIKVELARDNIDLFSFYREKEKTYILDFWSEKQYSAPVKKKMTSVKPRNVVKKIKKVKKVKKYTKIAKAKKEKKYKSTLNGDKEFRDFRYGASLIWNYAPVIPGLTPAMDISKKTPEYLYPIENREYQKDEKEAHMQIAINMFNRKKWGLMYKSIKLYEKKYGIDSNNDLNEYLKANAVLRTAIAKGEQGTTKMAVNMFENLAGVTSNFKMKKAILKYLIDYFIVKKDDVQILKYSKRLYVTSQKNLDFEESKRALNAIFYSLASLGQLDRINELTLDQSVKKLMPEQKILSYKIYSLMKQQNIDQAITLFKTEESRLLSPVEYSILYNIGEAYFRKAQYEKSIKLFDKFLVSYSHMTRSGNARLRIALSYELLGDNNFKTLELYKSSINRSSDYSTRFEAQIRYVGLKYIRKRKVDNSDNGREVFLKNPDPSNKMSSDLEELLWMVRLRSFIVDGSFKEALSYLRALPTGRMGHAKQRVFRNEGQEIVKGLILDYYKKSDYSMVVKIWEVYQNSYLSHVTGDSVLSYMMAKSLMHLGLNKTFDEFIQSRQSVNEAIEKTFPLWVANKALVKKKNYIEEIEVEQSIKLKDWQAAASRLLKLEKLDRSYKKISYYRGVIQYNRKKYKHAVKSLENFISNKSNNNLYEVSEMASALTAYTNSLYELGNDSKFLRVANAMLVDTSKYSKNKFMVSVRERVAFLEIELLLKRKNQKVDKIESKIVDFKKKFNKSIYVARVNFLLGKLLVSNNKEKEGLDLLKKVIDNEQTPNYLKELGRAEISYLKIKERTI